MDFPNMVFADGACSGNPGPGGWAAIVATPNGQVTELGGYEAETTNNRMELTAAGKALRFLEKTPGLVRIYTDSAYVIHGITKWVWGWRKKGWKNAEGEDVANAEFWKRLVAIVAHRRDLYGDDGKVEWHYVRGHAGVPGNERVDELAVEFSKGRRPHLYSGSLLKYDVAIHDLPDDTAPPEPKFREKPAEAAKPYGYLSLVGGEAMKHETWADCERRVKGVSGAKFKKIASADEEKTVLTRWGAKLKR